MRCGRQLPTSGVSSDLRVEGEIEEPHVQVKVDLEAAGRADVKPGDVRRASATVFSGIVVGYLFKEQKNFRGRGVGGAGITAEPCQPA